MGLFSRHRDDDDEMDEWAYELTRKDSYPLAATAAAVVAIAMACVVADITLPHSHLVAGPMGVGTLAALVAWGVAFAATIRHASIGWKIGSFVGLVVTGLVAGLIGVGTALTHIQEDMSAMADLKVDARGLVIVPDEPAPGPISRLSFAYFKELSQDATVHSGKMTLLGYYRITDSAAIADDPPLLRHCDQHSIVDPMIDAYYDRRRAALARYRGDLAKLDIDDDLKKGMIAGLDKSGNGPGDLFARAARIEHGVLTELITLCQILARRHWRAQFGQIGFTSTSDLTEFRAHAARATALSDEGKALTREGNAMVRQGTEMIRRSLF